MLITFKWSHTLAEVITGPVNASGSILAGRWSTLINVKLTLCTFDGKKHRLIHLSCGRSLTYSLAALKWLKLQNTSPDAYQRHFRTEVVCLRKIMKPFSLGQLRSERHTYRWCESCTAVLKNTIKPERELPMVLFNRYKTTMIVSTARPPFLIQFLYIQKSFPAYNIYRH